MSAPSNAASRRRFLKLSGGAVALIPLVNLYGCGEEEPEQPDPLVEPNGAEPTQQQPGTPPPGEPAQQRPAAQEPGGAQGQEPAGAQGQQPPGAQGQPGNLEVLDESNAQAQALGYKHSFEDVDQSAYPQYQEGQLCSNCNLYQPEMGDAEWGGCQIFPGKLVNANGWCSAYVPVTQT